MLIEGSYPYGPPKCGGQGEKEEPAKETEQERAIREESGGVCYLRRHVTKDGRGKFMIPSVVVTQKKNVVFIFGGPVFPSGSAVPMGSGWKGVREGRRDGLRAI